MSNGELMFVPWFPITILAPVNAPPRIFAIKNDSPKKMIK